MLTTVKHGHEIGYKVIRSIESKVIETKKIPCPTIEIDKMGFVDALTFHMNNTVDLFINWRPLFDVLRDFIKFLEL